jgi:flagellar assembly protein FliH
MAITEPTTSRVLRGLSATSVDGHAFANVSELPRVAAHRPRQTGNRALDAIRSAAWDEGYQAGTERGAHDGYTAGFERGVAEGRHTGHREGIATAHDEALRQVAAMIASTLDALEAGAREVATRDAVVLDDIESVVVDLAIGLAEAILEREISIVENPGREALARALALAPDAGDLVARMNPGDLARLGEVADLVPGRALELAPDPTVRSGGCLIEAGAARLDARIEAALDRAREVLGS